MKKTELLSKIREAVELEESFLPEIGYLMKEKILEYRLPADKEEKAVELLRILEKESRNHYELLKKAFERVSKSDVDEY